MNPDEHQILELLDKYWAGEATRAEIRILKTFFQSTFTYEREELKRAAPLFRYYLQASQVGAPVAPVEHDQRSAMLRRGARKKSLPVWMADYWEYAAVVLIFLAMTTGISVFRQQQKYAHAEVIQDTYADPQQAFAVTRQALLLISTQLNQVHREVQKLSIWNQVEAKIDGRR